MKITGLPPVPTHDQKARWNFTNGLYDWENGNLRALLDKPELATFARQADTLADNWEDMP